MQRDVSKTTTYPLIINNRNLVSNTNNSVYRYTFPNGNVFINRAEIAISSVSLYYCWFNITAAYGNNVFQFIHPATVTATYTVTIPDGNYSIPELNSFLQSVLIANGLYLIDGSGNFVYYLEILENPSLYSVQLNEYPVPIALPAGWTAPSNHAGFPAVAVTPQFIIAANAFRDIIGFTAATYPAVAQITTQSQTSSTTPQVSPIQSVLMTCSLLNNQYSNPNTVLYSLNAADVAFGALINSIPVEREYIPIQSGSYVNFDLQFLDQNFNAMSLQDSNLVIQLSLKVYPDL
jgi:hypothetical protein